MYQVTRIDRSLLYQAELNPRRVTTPAADNSLTESIRQNGILQPLIVQMSNGRFAVLDGSRRLESANALELPDLPCYIVDVTDTNSWRFAWIGNLQRQPLTFLDEADWFITIINALKIEPAELASILGLKETYVRARLNCYGWPPELRDYSQMFEISYSVAREYAKLGPGQDLNNALSWDRMLNPSSRQAASYVESILTSRESVIPPPLPPQKDAPAPGSFRLCHCCGKTAKTSEVTSATLCAACQEQIGITRESIDAMEEAARVPR